ncbi:MAG: phosphoglucomutase [Desulfobulbaceae bacterium]|nr:phosphoglucomutase [Desulfobulbaceae bacterium]
MLIEEAIVWQAADEPTAEELELFARFVKNGDHEASDYFALINELVKRRESGNSRHWQAAIDHAYALLQAEIRDNANPPTEAINFGTSGWRGRLGKDVCLRTVAVVTEAIIGMYRQTDGDTALAALLGVKNFAEAKRRGCVVGHDNRFAGDMLADTVVEMLCRAGFTVYQAGETTTGVLSASVLRLGAAFSINLTPSHNPLQYGGFKYNAADAGPAAASLTGHITENARALLAQPEFASPAPFALRKASREHVIALDSLACWQDLVAENTSLHGLSLAKIMDNFATRADMIVAIDVVHGASRSHLPRLLPEQVADRLIFLRANTDVTFGGIAPEPSTANMAGVVNTLRWRSEALKVGAIIDPDGDRIRFTDGDREITMNQFGAMAYHFLHHYKGKKGLVAKTVATSNLANALAKAFGEELFEPKVGFKEFKPVIGKALVMFEESDGISIIGHTPEKDAYIGLLLAMDMVETTGKNLGVYLAEIEREFGAYYPERDGVTVKIKGNALLQELAKLDKYGVGAAVAVGGQAKKIAEVITIDGRKMVLEDGSWLLIRPSGTEPKIRLYVESRDAKGAGTLLQTARGMLSELGLL